MFRNQPGFFLTDFKKLFLPSAMSEEPVCLSAGAGAGESPAGTPRTRCPAMPGRAEGCDAPAQTEGCFPSALQFC